MRAPDTRRRVTRANAKRRTLLAVVLATLIAGYQSTASAQLADSARVGATSSQASSRASASRADTSLNSLVRPSHVPRYKLIGLAAGTVSGLATDLYFLKQCSAETHSDGPPACLGLPIVAPLALFIGAFGGTVAGWIVGAAADAAQH